MYIQDDALLELESLYGRPVEMTWRQEITPPEMQMLKASQKNGRSHDFTFFISDGNDRVAVIRKHQHQPGVYRAPSGGADPEENLVEAILREAWEETGLKITIDRYLLRLKVIFYCNEISVPWTSHIITAKPDTLMLSPVDRTEIKEAKWVTWEELQGPIRASLQNSNLGLLQYRVNLTDAVATLLTVKDS
ncbi:MAG: NUDIX hydrolase [Clostridia bacterium]|nr:NUDIX hydrolase [Clostridia bacterium]